MADELSFEDAMTGDPESSPGQISFEDAMGEPSSVGGEMSFEDAMGIADQRKSLTPETDKAVASTPWYERQSPPWLKKYEDPIRAFANQRGIPEIPLGALPESARSTAAAVNAITGMATPANAAITAAMVAQPETVPFLLPAMMAPIAGHAYEGGKKIIAGTATPEESGTTAAEVAMLLAPGAHHLGRETTVPLPTNRAVEVNPYDWANRYGAPTDFPAEPITDPAFMLPAPPLPAERGVTAMEGAAPVMDIRAATNRFNELTAEGQALGRELELMRQAGLGSQVGPIVNRLAQIHSELARVGEPAETRFTANIEEPLSPQEAAVQGARARSKGLQPIEAEIGGEENAQQPGVQEVPVRETEVGGTEGARGEGQGAGDSDLSVGEAQGEGELGGVSGETPTVKPGVFIQHEGEGFEKTDQGWRRVTSKGATSKQKVSEKLNEILEGKGLESSENAALMDPEEFQKASGNVLKAMTDEAGGDWTDAAFDALEDNVLRGKPVNARLWDEIMQHPPEDYVRSNGHYVADVQQLRSVDPETGKRYGLADATRKAFQRAAKQGPNTEALSGFSRKYHGTGVEEVELPDLSSPAGRRLSVGDRSTIQRINAAAKAFGTRVRWFRNLEDTGTKMHGAHFKGEIFLNVDSSLMPTRQTFGHELGHYIQRRMPTLWKEMHRVITRSMTEQPTVRGSTGEVTRAPFAETGYGKRLIRAQYPAEHMGGELVSDFLAEAMDNPRALDRLSGYKPGFRERVSNAVSEFVDWAKGKIRGTAGIDKDSASYLVNDLEKVRKQVLNIAQKARPPENYRSIGEEVPLAARAGRGPPVTHETRAKETAERASDDIGKVNIDRLLEHGGSTRTNARRLRRFLPSERHVSGPAAMVRSAVTTLKDNLVRMTREAQKQPWAEPASKQYQGYNIMSHRFADELGPAIKRMDGREVRPEDFMVSESGLSPNTSPEQSFEASRRIAKMLGNNQNDRFDVRMQEWARNAKTKPEKGPEKTLYSDKELKFLKNKSLSELPAKGMWQAKWMRAYDQVYHGDRKLRTIRPDGSYGQYDKTPTGKPNSFAWTTFTHMQNGIDALTGARTPEQILKKPKTSNYYMSKLLAFTPSNHVVVDTHHTSAAFANSIPSGHELVRKAFAAGRGGKDRSYAGLYSIIHEATNQAAREVGMDPKELQALIWGYQRGYRSPDSFGRSDVGKKAVADIQQLWKDAAKGKITEEQAHEGTEEIANKFHGGTIPSPAYYEPGYKLRSGNRASEGFGDAGDPAELPGRRGDVGATERRGRGEPPGRVAGEEEPGLAEEPDFARAGKREELKREGKREGAGTGIKNAETERLRQERGLPESDIFKGKRTWEDAMREAKMRSDEIPDLVEELKTNPRALTDAEDMMLLVAQDKAEKAHDAAIGRVNANPGDRASLRQLEAARQRVQDIYDIDETSGTIEARGFNARKKILEKNYTLPRMEARVRAQVNQGRPLTGKRGQRLLMKTRQAYDRIQRADKALQRYQEKNQVRTGEASTDMPQYSRMGVKEPDFARSTKLERDRERVRAGIKDYRTRIAQKDISPRGKQRTPPTDPQLVKLLFERDAARSDYADMLARERLKAAPLYRKAGHYIAEVGVGLPRSIKSAFDLSAVFRQGGLIALGRPKEVATSVGPMLQALTSDRAQYGVMHQIKTDPKFPRMKRSGLEITEPGARMTLREEVFRSELAEKIPGVKASERAYTTYLNKLRADTFNGISGLAERWLGRNLTAGEDRIISNYINIASGRGDLGRFAPAANAASKILWSPRFAVSRIQWLSLQPIWGDVSAGGLAVRGIIGLEYARTLAGAGLMLGLASLAGASLEKDPRSGNFGIRFGNVRVDLTAGLKGYINFFARELTQKTKNQKGVVKPLGADPFTPDAWDLASKLGRGKLAPAWGSLVNVATGEQPTGQPTTPLNEALGFFTPISPQDVVNAMQADGVPLRAALALAAIGGMNVQEYEPFTMQTKRGERAQMQARDSALLHGDIGSAYRLTTQTAPAMGAPHKGATRFYHPPKRSLHEFLGR